MNSRISKKLISLGLMGTLLFSGAMPVVATNPSVEVQSTAQQTPLAVTNSSYAFEYEINRDGTGITITALPSDYSGSLTIPSTIDSLPVTSIGDLSFYNCTNLTSIIIPNSVTSIGYSAFFDCKNLISITIPDSIKSIGYSAFENTGWYNAQPNGIIYLNNWVIDYKGEMLVETKLSIKDGVVGICNCAFSYCNNLTTITIPDSVKIIENNAFYCCENLEIITIPNSVKSIGEYAFYCCENLTSITISDSVTNISDYAFSYCTSLNSITIPNSVSNIGYCAFSGCYSLTTITIPNSVTSIGDEVFAYCSEDLTVLCTKNSYAKTFAQENNIPYKEIELESNLYAMKLESTKAYNNGVLEDTNESVINSVSYKAKLQIDNYKTFLPARSVAQSLGLEVGYDLVTGATTISNGTKTIKVVPNSNNVIVVENGVETTINAGVAPIYVKGVIHIPVRAVLEQFGFFVNWHADGYLLITDYEVSSSDVDTLKAKVATVL